MAETLFKADVNKPMQDQEVPGHNRWHPELEPQESALPAALKTVRELLAAAQTESA